MKKNELFEKRLLRLNEFTATHKPINKDGIYISIVKTETEISEYHLNLLLEISTLVNKQFIDNHYVYEFATKSEKI